MPETNSSQAEKARPGMPPPRDYWVWDQVVRCGRTQEEVALDVSLSQVRVSQICRAVHEWLYEVWAHCLVSPNEEVLLAAMMLVGLREAAAHHGALPPEQRAQKKFYQGPPTASIFPRAGDSGSS